MMDRDLVAAVRLNARSPLISLPSSIFCGAAFSQHSCCPPNLDKDGQRVSLMLSL